MDGPALVRRSRFDGTRAFEVWSLVANPDRLPEWTPFSRAEHMGTVAPAPGQFIFATTRLGRRLRLAIDEWDAGHRVRVVAERRRGDAIVDVIVIDEGDGSVVEMRFRPKEGAVTTRDRLIWGWVMSRCLKRIARLV